MPTSDVKQDPTLTRLTWSPDGFTGQLGWTVSYPASEQAAKDLVRTEAGAYINAEHPRDDFMLCDNVNVDMSKRNIAIVTATYKTTDSPFPDKSNPLSEPPRIRARGGYENQAVDRDPNGKPLVNSAGEVYQNTYDDVRTRFFTITINLPFWTFDLDIAFANRCNSQPWNPLGIGSLARGQAKCLSIMPTTDITKDSKYVPVAFDFEIRQGQRALRLAGMDGVMDGFQRVLLDQGANGWYSPTQRGSILNDKGEVAGTVLLDSTGKPIETSYKISRYMDSPVSPLATPAARQTTGEKFEVFGPSAWFLTFQKTLFADFTTFGF